MKLDRFNRRAHRMMGLILLLPFLAWAASGMFFFIKPGYGEAYAYLQVNTYPLDPAIAPTPRETWLDYRLRRTILGSHLLVKTASESLHLNAETGEVWSEPNAADKERLIADAIKGQETRYGSQFTQTDEGYLTETGVKIKLNWQSLSLSQYGEDTARIDWVYKVHYLQWTGHQGIDRVLGFLGLALVALMALSGLRMFFKS